MEIWEPKPPGTLWATPGLLWESFTFTYIYIYIPRLTKIISSGITFVSRNLRYPKRDFP